MIHGILVTVGNMGMEAAAQWAKHTATFHPYLLITSTGPFKRYGIVRVIEETAVANEEQFDCFIDSLGTRRVYDAATYFKTSLKTSSGTGLTE
jgi:hypothetical protein